MTPQMTIPILIASYEFNRGRTLDLLKKIESLPEPAAAMRWRPGPGRAPLGWQFAHVAITEEIIAAERLTPGVAARHQELWPLYRAGATPDDNPPSIAECRQLLADCRQTLLESLQGLDEAQLEVVLPTLQDRGWRVIDVLHILGWHEAHHQGQAHAVTNLYTALQPTS